MNTLQDKIKHLLLTEMPEIQNTLFIERVADLTADVAVTAVKLAEKLENQENMNFNTSNWADSKDFMCALGREIERQYQRPIRSNTDKRKHNASVKAIYDKM